MVVTRRSRSNNSGDDESVASSSIGHRDREPQQPSHRPPPPPPPPPLQMPSAVSGISPRPTIGTASGINQTSSTREGGMNVSGSSDRNANASSSVRMGNNLNDARQSEQPNQYLQVRVSTPHYHASKIYRRHHHSQSDQRRLHGRKQQTARPARLSIEKGEIVRVLIPPTGFASERQLSDCLNHACNSDNDRNNNTIQSYADDASWDSTEEYFDSRGKSSNLAGMFQESDGVFVPLSIIYSQPRAFVNDVLSIARPTQSGDSRQHHHPIGKSSSIFVTFLEIFGIIAVTVASWITYSASQSVDWNKATNKLESIFLATMNLPFSLFDAVVEFPLKELYRRGPSFFGWEGESLARICSRVTHYGDEDFWRRNMEECEQIYASKEAAAMQIRKPILIGVFILMLFYMIRSIIEARRHPQIDPNMVETYRAITMLARQLKRAVNNNR